MGNSNRMDIKIKQKNTNWREIRKVGVYSDFNEGNLPHEVRCMCF